MKFAFKVLVAINCALVLAGAALMGLKIPLYANPVVVSRLWVVEYFADVPNGAYQLNVLRRRVLIEQVLLGIWIFDADSLAQHVLELLCSLHLLNLLSSGKAFNFGLHID